MGDVDKAISQIAGSADKVADAFSRFNRYLTSLKKKRLIIEALSKGARGYKEGALFTSQLEEKIKLGEGISANDLIRNIDHMIFIREEMILVIEMVLDKDSITESEASDAIFKIEELLRALRRLIYWFRVIREWTEDPNALRIDGDISTLIVATKLAMDVIDERVLAPTWSQTAPRSRHCKTAFDDPESRRALVEIVRIFRMLCDKLKHFHVEAR